MFVKINASVVIYSMQLIEEIVFSNMALLILFYI